MIPKLGDFLDEAGDGRRFLMHQTTQFAVLQAVTRLGLLDHLDAPMPVADLAQKAGADAGGVARIMAYLAADEVLDMDASGIVAPTARSAQLQALSSSICNFRLSHEAALVFDRALKHGEVAFETRFGKPVFQYLQDNPAEGSVFADVMRVTAREAEAFLFSAHEFAPFTRAVDIGGNRGNFLMRLLEDFPQASGVLLDLADTADIARSNIADTQFADRIEVVGGSFFDAVPTGGDFYLLKQILHDWGDEACLAILANTRAAMEAGVRLAVIERILPEVPTPSEAFDVDILMLLWTNGGRERTLSEYRAMLEQTGFAIERVCDNPDGQGVIEAVAV